MIILNVKKAKNLPEKIQGLIGKDQPYAFLLKTHFGIHTFGLKFPIDILILDKDNKVVAMKENLKANGIFFWNPLYNTVIELPERTIIKEKIRIGDQIKLVIN